jgi:pimeloyl-ACP methyl ester carboxylesterase
VHVNCGYADVNGTRLYYEMAGLGPAVVLIHGHTLDTRMWDDQFEPFARDYQVIRYDQRGYGKSALPSGESYSPADDLMALLRHLGLRSAHILGLSRGGAVAIDFALGFPEAATTLIAADAVLRGFQWTSFGVSLAEIHSLGKSSGVEAARQRWLSDALFAASLENPRVAPRLKQIVGEYSGWAWVNNEPLRPLDPPSIQQLDRIRIPTLVVVGERDVPDFRAIAHILHQRIPNASKVVMAGVGHMCNMEDPARFNEVVLSFLADQ